MARGQANGERLEEALHELRFVDAPLLGIIINRAEVSRRYRSYELAETEELALVVTNPAIIGDKGAEHHVHANDIPVEQAVSGHEAAEPASALR